MGKGEKRVEEAFARAKERFAEIGRSHLTRVGLYRGDPSLLGRVSCIIYGVSQVAGLQPRDRLPARSIHLEDCLFRLIEGCRRHRCARCTLRQNLGQRWDRAFTPATNAARG